MVRVELLTYLEETAEEERAGVIISEGKKHFQNSALTSSELPITSQTITSIREFLTSVEPGPDWPKTGSNWRHPKGPLEHIVLAGKIARGITEAIDESGNNTCFINPYQMEAVGLLHDLGRLIKHDFYVTDLLTDTLMEKMGIIPAIRESHHKIEWYWNIEEKLDLYSITPEQKISVLADVLAKRHSKEPFRLRRPDEIIDEVKLGKIKYLERPPKSFYDFQMRERIGEYGKREENVLNNTLAWLEEMNIDLNPLLSRLDQELQSDLFLKQP